MSYQFYLYYNSIKKPFIILKENKSKTQFTLKEKHFKFKVNLKEITCTLCPKKKLCDIKKCYHIYELFRKYYNVSEDLLPFLWINNNHINLLKNDKLQIDENDIECPICLESTYIINKPNKKIIQCMNCNKYYHSKCINKIKNKICQICFTNINY
tara:strand:- start:95 stop:559 length:465 start_codon:yes stop_codon:yes gene_type:complete